MAVAGQRGPGRDELRAYVSSRPRAELVEILLGAVERDRVLRDSLQLEMAAAAGDAADALAAAIDDAAFVANDLRWDQVWPYADRLDAVLAVLEGRLAGGHAAEVVALAERFVAAVAAQLEYVDDSSGTVGSTLARARRCIWQPAVKRRPIPSRWRSGCSSWRPRQTCSRTRSTRTPTSSARQVVRGLPSSPRPRGPTPRSRGHSSGSWSASPAATSTGWSR